jgi:hypothetical protein
LTNAAALAQESEKHANPTSKALLGIFRMEVQQSVDWKYQVIHIQGTLTPRTSVLGKLARVAAPAGNGFAVANRGKKLKVRHGFPLNALEVKLSE